MLILIHHPVLLTVFLCILLLENLKVVRETTILLKCYKIYNIFLHLMESSLFSLLLNKKLTSRIGKIFFK